MTGRGTTQHPVGSSRRRATRLVLAVLVAGSLAALAVAVTAVEPAERATSAQVPSGATTHALEVAAPEAVTVAAAPASAPAVEDAGPIPASVGTPGAGGFRVSLAGLPEGISAERFLAVASRSGRRWGLTFLGTTPAGPVSGDGRNVIGFGTTTIAGAGAETTSHPHRATRTRRCARARVVKRVRVGRADAPRVMRRALTVRRCRMVLAERASIEEDIVVDRTMPWQGGPAYPTAWEVDLETVLLHEFGHVAGHGHVSGCVSSPMWTSLSMGDWWRGVGDMRHAVC